MKKNILSIILCFMFILSAVGLVSCSDGKSEDDNYKFIELTLDNYEYYLTISSQLVNSVNISGGRIRLYYYTVYISGAINGIYEDCVLYLKNGSEIKLNASGNANTSRTINNGEDSFNVVKVEGKIRI